MIKDFIKIFISATSWLSLNNFFLFVNHIESYLYMIHRLVSYHVEQTIRQFLAKWKSSALLQVESIFDATDVIAKLFSSF